MKLLSLKKIPIMESKPFTTYDDKKEENYLSIPGIYSESTWPKKTNTLCYNCCNAFNRIPLFVPVSMLADGTINRGNNPVVCSVSCGMNWIASNSRDEQEKRKYISLLRKLYEKITGLNIIDLYYSPDRSNMSKFGGQWSQKQYEREIMATNMPHIRKQYSLIEDFEEDNS